MDRQFEPQTVGERIKFLREKNGESQQKLGEILGLTQNAISKLENGDTSLTLENQIRIAEHYNVSHDYICTGRNNDSILTLLEKYLSLKYICYWEEHLFRLISSWILLLGFISESFDRRKDS